MALSACQIVFLCAVGIVLLARPVEAFGAGNIGSTSKVEGQNWRHGDLEDTLLTIVASKAMGGKKFGKLDVKRVYFGNWLRDYSQAVDVGTVKNVSAEAIRILLWVLGFMSFGYGSGEFEVTSERLGCYRPEEHIDNPKDYADNEDARQYDRRLRGPVDERRELAINPETGLKNYIASENMGIDTSAGLIRRLFGRSIQLGRQYARNKNKKDLYEALRLLGTGCHCLEDFAAHSNYVELALMELGEREVFPHVGRRTAVQLRGVRHPVYPIVTGTFGGVDFLHSVCGEFDDKATQSEIQELEGTLNQYQNGGQDNSILQGLLNQIPSGIFGGKNEADKMDELKQNAVAHQMQNTHISPRQPEEWIEYLNDVQRQIYPIIEWHDEIMQSITETIEKIPILPDLIEQIQDQINKFVFSLLAPYVVPIIDQVKTELNTGSNEIIQSSSDKQHIVFNDDDSSDPTHSMISKDHFSNILNEPAGKVASQTVKWVVPQLIACWDDERIDVQRTLNRIIYGVLHHPALRDFGQDGVSDGRRLMFGVVEQWWREKSESERDTLREQLSRRGVETGQNHKEGVVDHGHGNNRPLGMANLNRDPIAGNALGAISSAFGGSELGGPSSGSADQFGKVAGEALGGGALGAIVGGLTSGLGGNILGDVFDGNNQTYASRDSYSQGVSYAQAPEPGRGGYESYGRFEPVEQRQPEGRYYEETRPYGAEREEPRHGHHGAEPRYGEEDQPRHHGHGRHEEENESGGFRGDYGRSEAYERRERREEYSSGGYGERDEFRTAGGYRGPERESEYGGYGRRQDQDESRDVGRSEEESGFDGGFGRRTHEEYGSGYGRREEEYGGRQQEEYGSAGFGGGRQDDGSGGYASQSYGQDETEGYGGEDRRRWGGDGEEDSRY